VLQRHRAIGFPAARARACIYHTTEVNAMDDDMLDRPFESDDGPVLDEIELDDLRQRLLVAETERDEAVAARDAALESHTASQQALLERLREALAAANPLVPAELVRGETLEELEANVEAARRVVDRVREEAGASARTSDPGGGASGRVTASPRTARDKIREGLADR
jgi:multidrug resistance efflux pump